MFKAYKIIVSVILLLSLINVLAMLGWNVWKAVHAYAGIFQPGAALPVLDIMEIVGGLLVVILLLIMNIGFLKLFLPDSKMAKAINLPWLQISSFTQLKMLLIETIITTLVIFFATHVLKSEQGIVWQDILIPAAVFLFALTMKFVKDK